MGLDQYLYKKTYVKRWAHMNEEELYTVDVLKGGNRVEHINPEKVAYVVEEVAYWRKANQIHKWFVDNIQEGVDNCGEYWVSVDALKELVDKCKKALENRNVDTAEAELPTQGGFLFGDTSYSDYYYDDLERTVEMLQPLIDNEGRGDVDFYYHSSW